MAKKKTPRLQDQPTPKFILTIRIVNSKCLKHAVLSNAQQKIAKSVRGVVAGIGTSAETSDGMWIDSIVFRSSSESAIEETTSAARTVFQGPEWGCDVLLERSAIYDEDSNIETTFKTLKPTESRQWVEENPWSRIGPSIDPSRIPQRLKPLSPFLDKYFGVGGSTDVLDIFKSKQRFKRYYEGLSPAARSELNVLKRLVLKLQKRRVATKWINEVDLESEEDGPISIEKKKMLYLIAFMEELNRLGFFADEKIAEGSFLEWDEIELL